mmetsp:Transcript_12640/g.44741  ORF Transcript_12640/g.44741 Transcript_12640/m.44741 type:complete len:118 (+) Transcript_12640:929-1282(+)
MGSPGYCELAVPDREKPAWLRWWEHSIANCQQNWPEERCAAETGEEALLTMVLAERQATADPSLPVPDCAHDLLEVLSVAAAAPRRTAVRPGTAACALAALALAAVIQAPGAVGSIA